MPNALTGDYEVVTQFTEAALNRILAGMHRGNRFPHSLSMRVDDTPESTKPTRAAVDIDGKAITDRVAAARKPQTSGPERDAITVLAGRTLDTTVPHDPRKIGLRVFSHLRGLAQLQLGAPLIELPQDESASATVRTPVMIRYSADSGTASLPPFLRGEFLTQFGVTVADTPAGAFASAGLSGPATGISFRQLWPGDPMLPEDLAALNGVLRATVLSSFQPSTSSVSGLGPIVQFKSMRDAAVAAAMMTTAEESAPDPGSVQAILTAPGDEFAIGLSADSVAGPVAKALNSALDNFRRFTFDKEIDVHSFIGSVDLHIVAEGSLLTARWKFEDPTPGSQTGRMVLVIPVQVRFPVKNVIPFVELVDFDFVVTQAFTLQLQENTAGLRRIGPVVLDIPAGVPVLQAGALQEAGAQVFEKVWTELEPGLQRRVNSALSTANLTAFLTNLMNPKTPQPADLPPERRSVPIEPVLSYTSFEINRNGIVLHGSLSLPPWPAPHVEFDLDAWTAGSPQPEFNALNSWIPGGTIDSFVWSYRGQQRQPDPNTFVSSGAPAIGWSPRSVCLSIQGSRIAASGPAVAQRVTLMRCKSTTVPSLDSTPFESIVRADLPQLALLRPSPVDPHVHEVAGHVSPWVNGAVKNTANYLIHFPGSDSAGGGRQLLEQAVAAAHARPRAALAVLCVMTPSQLRDTRPVDGVLYADDAVGWRRLLDVAAGPETVLVGPAGKVLWRHQGTVPPEALLAEALRTNLDDGAGHFVPEFSAPKLRAGMAAPNFLFESPAGNYLSLRALAGRPVVLCFGGAASAPARATLENLQRSASAKGALLLSIVDREASGYNADAAAPPGVIVVDDPERQIGDAYGVSLWPTTVYLNAEGLITNVRPGLIAAESRSATPAGEYGRNA